MNGEKEKEKRDRMCSAVEIRIVKRGKHLSLKLTLISQIIFQRENAPSATNPSASNSSLLHFQHFSSFNVKQKKSLPRVIKKA